MEDEISVKCQPNLGMQPNLSKRPPRSPCTFRHVTYVRVPIPHHWQMSIASPDNSKLRLISNLMFLHRSGGGSDCCLYCPHVDCTFCTFGNDCGGCDCDCDGCGACLNSIGECLMMSLGLCCPFWANGELPCDVSAQDQDLRICLLLLRFLQWQSFAHVFGSRYSLDWGNYI